MQNIFRPPLNNAFKNEHQLAILTSWKGTAETNTHYFCIESKLKMITAELPSKYHNNFKHFLWLCKTIAIVK